MYDANIPNTYVYVDCGNMINKDHYLYFLHMAAAGLINITDRIVPRSVFCRNRNLFILFLKGEFSKYLYF